MGIYRIVALMREGGRSIESEHKVADNNKNNESLVDARHLRGEMLDLARLVGVEAALKIGQEFGGVSFYVPSMSCIPRARRNERIRREYAKGRRIRDISKTFGLTERTIFNVIKSGR